MDEKEMSSAEEERQCKSCPYPAVGFICGNPDDCMQTRVRKIIRKDKEAYERSIKLCLTP